jgi:hypothetical protein
MNLKTIAAIQLFVKNPKFSRKAGEFSLHEACSKLPTPAVTLKCHLCVRAGPTEEWRAQGDDFRTFLDEFVPALARY